MKKFDKSFEDDLEKAIEDIEEKTSVEVVVAVAPSCDPYIDAYLKGGFITFITMLLFILYSPVTFSETLVPLELAMAFIVGMLVVWAFAPVKRVLVSPKRRSRYLNQSANTFFLENRLTETQERSAFLVYVSAFEKQLKLLPDRGVESAVPMGDWKEIETVFNDIFKAKSPLPQAILDALPSVIEPFSQFLPPAEDNIDELPNRLRRVE